MRSVSDRNSPGCPRVTCCRRYKITRSSPISLFLQTSETQLFKSDQLQLPTNNFSRCTSVDPLSPVLLLTVAVLPPPPPNHSAPPPCHQQPPTKAKPKDPRQIVVHSSKAGAKISSLRARRQIRSTISTVRIRDEEPGMRSTISRIARRGLDIGREFRYFGGGLGTALN